jgi:hypothetical protein
LRLILIGLAKHILVVVARTVSRLSCHFGLLLCTSRLLIIIRIILIIKIRRIKEKIREEKKNFVEAVY